MYLNLLNWIQLKKKSLFWNVVLRNFNLDPYSFQSWHYRNQKNDSQEIFECSCHHCDRWKVRIWYQFGLEVNHLKMRCKRCGISTFFEPTNHRVISAEHFHLLFMEIMKRRLKCSQGEISSRWMYLFSRKEPGSNGGSIFYSVHSSNEGAENL